MRLAVLLLLVGAVAAQKAKFQTKFENLVTKYLGANTGKAIDLVGNDAYAEKSMDDIVSNLMSNIISLVPSNKALGAMGMLSTFSNCLKGAGSSTEKAMANVGGAFKAKLQPLYKKVLDKIKTMKKNGKAKDATMTEGYKIATAGLTKALIQGVINACMAKSTKAEYDCSLNPLNTIMNTAQYNMVYDKARG